MIIGTSLTVFPIASIVNKIDFEYCNRVVINKTKLKLKQRPNYNNSKSNDAKDFQLNGDCDKIIEKLITALKWDKQLEQELALYKKKFKHTVQRQCCDAVIKSLTLIIIFF